jgi:hypothetical protein
LKKMKGFSTKQKASCEYADGQERRNAPTSSAFRPGAFTFCPLEQSQTILLCGITRGSRTESPKCPRNRWKTQETAESSDFCRSRKQRQISNLRRFWNPRTDLGCKRSAVQIRSPRLNSLPSFPRVNLRFLVLTSAATVPSSAL